MLGPGVLLFESAKLRRKVRFLSLGSISVWP